VVGWMMVGVGFYNLLVDLWLGVVVVDGYVLVCVDFG